MNDSPSWQYCMMHLHCAVSSAEDCRGLCSWCDYNGDADVVLEYVQLTHNTSFGRHTPLKHNNNAFRLLTKLISLDVIVMLQSSLKHMCAIPFRSGKRGGRTRWLIPASLIASWTMGARWRCSVALSSGKSKIYRPTISVRFNALFKTMSWRYG